jgi:hypothetical protein
MEARIASVIVFIFSGIGASAGSVLFFVFWWMDLLFLLSFLVYVPQSKRADLFLNPSTLFSGAPIKSASSGRLILKK